MSNLSPAKLFASLSDNAKKACRAISDFWQDNSLESHISILLYKMEDGRPYSSQNGGESALEESMDWVDQVDQYMAQIAIYYAAIKSGKMREQVRASIGESATKMVNKGLYSGHNVRDIPHYMDIYFTEAVDGVRMPGDAQGPENNMPFSHYVAQRSNGHSAFRAKCSI